MILCRYKEGNGHVSCHEVQICHDRCANDYSFSHMTIALVMAFCVVLNTSQKILHTTKV